jgi:hypothetical protein
VSIYLSPDMVNFNQPVRLTVNTGRVAGEPFIRPDLEVMLEDVRTRGDRQHPFWARIDAGGGRMAAR